MDDERNLLQQQNITPTHKRSTEVPANWHDTGSEKRIHQEDSQRILRAHQSPHVQVISAEVPLRFVAKPFHSRTTQEEEKRKGKSSQWGKGIIQLVLVELPQMTGLRK
ncbi:hypothetical protein TNCV_1222761 [Trichonephila clavipes]|nr:hypothetical protein TNCV_1222761 [Trichonephila clavipes]